MTIKARAFSPCFEWSHWKKSLPTLSRRTYSGQQHKLSLTFPEVNITPCFIDNTKYLVINFQIPSQRHLGIMKKKTFKGMEIDSVTAYCHTITIIIATSIASITTTLANTITIHHHHHQ